MQPSLSGEQKASRRDQAFKWVFFQNPSEFCPCPDDWKSLDCLFFGVGVDQDIVYSKSTSLQTWLVGYELTDPIVLFTESTIHFLASKKKIDFLRQLESSSKGAPPDFPASIKLMVRDKADNDKSNFEQLVDAIKESKKGSTLGVIAKVIVMIRVAS